MAEEAPDKPTLAKHSRFNIVWQRVFDVAVIGALISGISAIVNNHLSEDVLLCKEATTFLTDDIKDTGLLTDQDWKKLGKFYMEMAMKSCKND